VGDAGLPARYEQPWPNVQEPISSRCLRGLPRHGTRPAQERHVCVEHHTHSGAKRSPAGRLRLNETCAQGAVPARSSPLSLSLPIKLNPLLPHKLAAFTNSPLDGPIHQMPTFGFKCSPSVIINPSGRIPYVTYDAEWPPTSAFFSRCCR